MMTFIRPRLRKPAGNALAGTVFAAAWVIRGGPTWWLSIVIEVTVLVRAVLGQLVMGYSCSTRRAAIVRCGVAVLALGVRSRGDVLRICTTLTTHHPWHLRLTPRSVFQRKKAPTGREFIQDPEQ